jgi:colicin import membrane protein
LLAKSLKQEFKTSSCVLAKAKAKAKAEAKAKAKAKAKAEAKAEAKAILDGPNIEVFG